MGLFARLKANLGSLLASAEDPLQPTVSAYQRQVDLLGRLRAALQEVSSSKQQLGIQRARLAAKLAELEQQARAELSAGREDVARLALRRRHAASLELQRLDARFTEVADEEQRLALAEQGLSARIEEVRTRQEVTLARYTAAEAQVRINEALAGLSDELADLGLALEQAEVQTEGMQARAAAIDALAESGALAGSSLAASRVDHELAQIDEATAVEEQLAALQRNIARETGDPEMVGG